MRALRVALIYPRVHAQVRSFLTPLGLLSLATLARNAGHRVRVFDPSFDRDLGPVRRQLEAFGPDVVGLSVTTDLYPNARELCRFAKGLGATTVMGGPHATVCAAEAWEDCPHLDVIVSGEGERSFPELLDRLARGADLAGLRGASYRSEGGIIENEPSGWIEDLDTLPLPDRSLLPTYERYSASGYTGLVLTRGCPFSCNFCQPALEAVAGRFRLRSARSVVDEIEQLHARYGNRRFHIDDDLFVLQREWIREIADLLEERGLLGRLRFIVLSRVDTFDAELARLLRRLGVYYVMFGVESGSQAVLDSLTKRITPSRIEAAFALARAHGFRTHAFVILGSPEETRESLRRTEELVRRLDPTSLFLSQYVPLPGTRLRKALEEQGRLDITSHEQMSYFAWAGATLPVKNPNLDKAEVVAARDRILASRRGRFVLDNVGELLSVVIETRSIRPVLLHGRFYLKKRHFNG